MVLILNKDNVNRTLQPPSASSSVDVGDGDLEMLADASVAQLQQPNDIQLAPTVQQQTTALLTNEMDDTFRKTALNTSAMTSLGLIPTVVESVNLQDIPLTASFPPSNMAILSSNMPAVSTGANGSTNYLTSMTELQPVSFTSLPLMHMSLAPAPSSTAGDVAQVSDQT